MVQLEIKGGAVFLESSEFTGDFLHCFTGVRNEQGDNCLNQKFNSRPIRFARQVHGTDILELPKETKMPDLSDLYEADAIITNINRFPVGIYTADCLPVLLYDPVNRAIAVIHAGWRSSVFAIISKVIDRMTVLFSTRPENLKALMGPSIQVCCFEVGSDVEKKIRSAFPEDDSLHKSSETKWHLDLKKFNVNILKKSGVQNIYDIALCTCCNAGLFYSYRRDHSTSGRMISSIMLNY